ncbi:MAG TPA: hypothetical protein GX521_00530 [Firmicutes bacterium]|nr:hypothetical protein [Bacillota bacterium]
MGRWVLVTILLIVALIVAFTILAATGVIDAAALFWKLGLKIAWLKPHLETYSRGQDSEEWIAVKEEELRAELGRLGARENELAVLEKELQQQIQALERREADVDKREVQLQSQQEQKRNVQTLAELYGEMSAADAAKILQKLDQPLLLEVLLSMDMQDAANILLELPTDLAVSLSKTWGSAGK